MKDHVMYNETDLSTKEVIILLWNGRRLIALFSIIGLLISFLANNVLLEKTYEANAVLLVSNAISQPVVSSTMDTGLDGLVDTLSGNIPQTITTYREQIITNDVLSRVRLKLDLEGEFSNQKLSQMIEVVNIKDTNLLDIVVKAHTPELARDIANTLASEFSVFVAEMNSERLSKSSEFLKMKVAEEKIKLEIALEEYKIFLAKSPGASEVKSEIQSKSERLRVLKEQLDAITMQYTIDTIRLDGNIEVNKREIEKYNALIEETEQFIVRDQSIYQDNAVSSIAQSANLSINELSNLIIGNEEINENFVELQSGLNSKLISLQEIYQRKENLDYEYQKTIVLVESEINELSKEVETLKITFADKDNEERLITKNLQRAESSYDQFVKSYEDTRVAESADIGKSTILINSKAN